MVFSACITVYFVENCMKAYVVTEIAFRFKVETTSMRSDVIGCDTLFLNWQYRSGTTPPGVVQILRARNHKKKVHWPRPKEGSKRIRCPERNSRSGPTILPLLKRLLFTTRYPQYSSKQFSMNHNGLCHHFTIVPHNAKSINVTMKPPITILVVCAAGQDAEFACDIDAGCVVAVGIYAFHASTVAVGK
jgi:hypothetical protein